MRSLISRPERPNPRAVFMVRRSVHLTGQIIELPMVYGGVRVAGPLVLVQRGDGVGKRLRT